MRGQAGGALSLDATCCPPTRLTHTWQMPPQPQTHTLHPPPTTNHAPHPPTHPHPHPGQAEEDDKVRFARSAGSGTAGSRGESRDGKDPAAAGGKPRW